MTFLILIIKALAAYRLAVLVVYDNGPLHVFWHVRDFFDKRRSSVPMDDKARHDDFWRSASFGGRFWQSAHELFSCPFCLGGWAALLVFILPDWAVWWLAVWGIQTLLQQTARVLNGMRKGEVENDDEV